MSKTDQNLARMRSQLVERARMALRGLVATVAYGGGEDVGGPRLMVFVLPHAVEKARTALSVFGIPVMLQGAKIDGMQAHILGLEDESGTAL